ncbi:MAG: HupE/UreJ family protein [Fluviicola sp.]|nr:HupE/UreJ family protein [Fluviicola sp.]
MKPIITALKNNPSLQRQLRLLVVICCLLCIPQLASAHAMDLKNLPTKDVAALYLKLGYTHILPLGLDHILFVLCLFFLSPKLKTVLWQSLAFTVAHSITLGLCIFGVISPPSHIIEPIIALSIVFVAVENMIVSELKPTRMFLVAAFGLIHGMGFASVLKDLGMPEDKFATSLITFNVGVELGQITVILIAWLLVGKWFSKKPWYKKRIVIPISAVIAVIALYWTIERTFFAG